VVIFFRQNSVRADVVIKQKSVFSTFFWMTLFSLCVMYQDYHAHRLSDVRRILNGLVSPFLLLVNAPIELMDGWFQLGRDKALLIEDNHRLRFQQTVLEIERQHLRVIKNENAELKELLMTASSFNDKAMAAEILSVDMTSSRQVVIVNKGSREGIFVGQPALDAKGLIGQVIDVGFMTSTLLLVSDAKSAVPVRNDRTGERGILVGTNHMMSLALINIPKSSSLREGDTLVTSGLGRKYPEGYPVGLVEKVQSVPGDDFVQIRVTPLALLNRSRMVLLTWPYEHQKQLIAELADRQCFLDKELYAS